MNRKSAAKVKPVKAGNSGKLYEKQELPPIEETFDNIKKIMVTTAEVQVVIAGRVDNLVNLRKAAYSFWGDMIDQRYNSADRMTYFKDLQSMTVGLYEDILDIVRSFELDEFLKEDMRDYFADIAPKVSEIESENDLFVASIVADCIKPWGEKMTQLHHQMLDEQGQRKAIETEGPVL